MSASSSFKDAWNYAKSLLIGLGVTGKSFVKPSITVIYPWQQVDNLSTYRGHVELIPKDDDPFTPRCVACGACADACPSRCLSVVAPPKAPKPKADAPAAALVEGRVIPKTEKAAVPERSRAPVQFFLDYSLCSLCGQCERVCPAKSLRFSNNVYLIGHSREDFRIDLLARMKSQAAGQPAPPRPKAPESAPAPETEKEPA